MNSLGFTSACPLNEKFKFCMKNGTRAVHGYAVPGGSQVS